MATLFTSPKFQAFDADGNPLAGGKVATFAAGTNTPKATYTTEAGNVANTNPVILDASGQANIWLGSGSYKFIVTKADDTAAPDGTVDNISGGVTVGALSSTDDVNEGAGLVSYTVALAYPAGTVGGKLRQYLSVFDYMTAAQIADVQAGSLTLDVTSAVQAAINAAYGRILFVPRGGYRITAALTIDPILGGTTSLPLHIVGEGFDANGGNGGTFFKVEGAGNGFTIDNSYGINADARFILEGFGIIGDGTDAVGGDGIYVKNLSNLILRNLWIQNCRRDGIFFDRCYGSAVEDCTLINNRVWNFHADKAFNLGDLRRIKAYGGGRTYSAAISGNVCIRGSGDENLGVKIDNVDVSYSGTSAFRMFKRSDSTLTSIVVSGGVATATTATAHNLSSGALIGVVGATVAPALNTNYPPAITVTTATAFTFATTAANGTYTESTIQIGPGAFGFFVDQTRGLTLQGYAEDCIGPALYVGAEVDAFEVIGGYWQGASLGCVIINDSAQSGRYAAMFLNGAQARMLVNVPDGPHNVDVAGSIVTNSSATITLPTIYKRDGTYYAPAAPTAGTWVAGTYIKRSNPTVGGPKGWYCTVGGTPGTWVSEGNL